MRVLLTIIFIGLLLVPNIMTAEEIDCSEIMDKVDENMMFNTAKSHTKLTIKNRDRTDVKELISYSQGRKKSFSEVLRPAKEEGMKYLKIEDDLWMYLPDVNKVVQISGHMLRQSMLGSDFSYEDMLENSESLEKNYKCEFTTMDTVDSYECYVLVLEGITRDVTYPKRKIWIDKKRYVGIKEELYAKSGKLLKVMKVEQIDTFNDRYYPVTVVMKDKLRKDSKTTMELLDIQFDIDLSENLFSKRNLRRK